MSVHDKIIDIYPNSNCFTIKETQAKVRLILLMPTTRLSTRDPATHGDRGTDHVDPWLVKTDFYHGFLPREDIIYLLRKHGDFLVRTTEVSTSKDQTKPTKKETVISVLMDPDGKFLEIGDSESRHDLVRNIIVYHRKLHYYVEHSMQFELLRDLFKWELQHKNVTIGRVLGRGAFGEVRKGTLLRRPGKSVPVAVKTLKSDTELSKAKIKEMMKEARLMRNLKHPNVVCIYGVALLEQPLYIVLEFVPGGALDSYLKRNKATIDRDERLLMAMGAAWGMEYLHKSSVLHRDIAARNCLYDTDKIVKISDFGLSRKGSVYKMQTAKKMPIKWMAPESITTFMFSQKSDVYSYGILVYEIFAGAEPYEGIPNSATRKMILEGKLNDFPEGAPAKLVEYVKTKMWHHNPDERHDMGQIVSWMEKYTGLVLDVPQPTVAREVKDDDKGANKTQATTAQITAKAKVKQKGNIMNDG
ncbi:unnamed protein product [Cylicocyclus nassatus]|uniref:Tyrosine-protein kinase n=1 Tax=Cylicocyclus nassatus TaxID=53992 RepID=A0AA36MBX7_CYLNA|nr:unnamed protein product [Cylicocyclus nassatus]